MASIMLEPVASIAKRLLLPPEGIIARTNVLARHAQVVRKIWPAATCTPVGSFPNSLASRYSDVDVVIELPQPNPIERIIVTDWTTKFKNALLEEKVADQEIGCNVALTTRTPLVTYTDAAHGIRVDTSFGQPVAIRKTDYVKWHMDWRPQMRDIYILMKNWLRWKNLHKPYDGGMGSYPLALTLIGYFRFKSLSTRSGMDIKPPTTSMATDTLILKYLDFYTLEWDHSKVLHPGWGFILEKTEVFNRQFPRNTTKISILDPCDPKNDVGGTAWRFGTIKRDMLKLRKDVFLARARQEKLDQRSFMRAFGIDEVTGEMLPPLPHTIRREGDPLIRNLMT